MSSRRYSLISLTLISSLALFILAPAKAANSDDGYPEGVAAPGRTCPNSDEGFSAVSEISGKTLVCTMINGVKKWWIKGEPLPTAPTATAPTPSETPKTPTGDTNLGTPEIKYVPK